MSEYLSAKQAASYTGISLSKLSKLRQTGRGCQYIRIGDSSTKAKILYKKTDLDNWLLKYTVKTFGGA